MKKNLFYKYVCLAGSLLILATCSTPRLQQQIAYQMDWQIWVMNPDGTHPHLLMKTDAGAGAPRWSPDGRRLAFVASWPEGKAAIWTADSLGSNLQQVSPKFDSISAVWLNQDVLLTTVMTDTGQTWNNPQAHYALDLRDGTMHEYSRGPASVIPLPQGDRWLAWAPMSGTLTLYTLKGQAQSLFHDYVLSGLAAFDVSPSGDEVVFQGRKGGPIESSLSYRIYRTKIDPISQTEPQEILDFDCCVGIRWSPDGSWIALLDQRSQFHLVNANTNKVEITFQAGALVGGLGSFLWSPDSQWLLVSLNYGTSKSNNVFELAKIEAQTGAVVRLTDNDKTELNPDWGPAR